MRTMFDVPSPNAPIASRRREPRVAVRDTLSARAVGRGGPIVLAVRDLGFRGFAIETPGSVAPGAKARFEFLTNDVLLFTAEAVAVHCFRQGGAPGRFVSGWEFPEQAGLDEAIERLIDEAVGVLTIE